jgi:hypothetical protein
MCVTTIHGGLNINSVPRACRRLLILATTDCASRAHSAIDWRCIIGVRAQLAKALSGRVLESGPLISLRTVDIRLGETVQVRLPENALSILSAEG